MHKEEVKKVAHVITTVRGLESTTWRGKLETPDGEITSVIKRTAAGGYELTALKDGGKRYDLMPNGMTFSHTKRKFHIGDTLEERHQERISRRRIHTTIKYVLLDFKTAGKLGEDGSFFRSVTPISRKFKSQFIFDMHIMADDVNGRCRKLLVVTLQGNTFHIYSVEDAGQSYLFIDSRQRLTFKEFDEACWTISISLAFFNGHLWQQKHYVFSYPTSDMHEPDFIEYHSLRTSLLSVYSSTTSNPGSWMREKDKNGVLEYKLKDRALFVSTKLLSQLCNWVHEKAEHMIAVLLIVESKCSSLLMMPSGFAIALEGLATLFEEWFPDKTKPITDKNKAKLLIAQMHAVLEGFKDDASVDTEVLRRKVDALNCPTNRNRLKIPFKLLHIPLSEDDELALDYRNTLLHGNVGLIERNKDEFEMQETELGMRLLTLANAVILKLIGYEGWIVNHAKTQEFGKVVNEPYLRDIGSFENIDPDVLKIIPR